MCLAFADLPPGFNQPAVADQAAIGSEICAKRTDRAKPRGRRGKAWSGYAVEVTSQKMLYRNSLPLAPYAITDRFLQLLLLALLSNRPAKTRYRRGQKTEISLTARDGSLFCRFGP
jgi:hypothetical protein